MQEMEIESRPTFSEPAPSSPDDRPRSRFTHVISLEARALGFPIEARSDRTQGAFSMCIRQIPPTHLYTTKIAPSIKGGVESNVLGCLSVTFGDFGFKSIVETVRISIREESVALGVLDSAREAPRNRGKMMNQTAAATSVHDKKLSPNNCQTTLIA
jgi:hypothetical protein